MFGMGSRTENEVRKVHKATDKAQFNNLRHAIFSTSKAAKQSIRRSKKPSMPGNAPTTRGKGGKNLRGSIFTNTNKDSAIAGPRASVVGTTGNVHEFGNSRGGVKFPQRPFMFPALEASAPRFAADWAGTIGQ